MTALGTLPGGEGSVGYDINDSGQVAGVAGDAAGTQHAFVTGPNGTGLVDLGTPGLQSQGSAINSSGQVAGTTWVVGGDGAYHAALWTGTTLTDLGTLGGLDSYAEGINDAGVVTGSTYTAQGTAGSAQHAFVWSATTGMRDLNSLISANSASQPTLTQAFGINSNGWIVAEGSDSHAYLLKPTYLAISPSTLSFGNELTGSTSNSQIVTISNTGTATITLGTLSTSTGFSQSNDCSATLAAGAECTAKVTFTPTAAGTQSGALTVTADGNQYSVALGGVGTITATLSASGTRVPVDTSVTLTWTATAGATCTATGGASGDGWTGNLPASGSKAVTESGAGDFTYNINCDAATQKASAQAKVTVYTPASGGGGGGAIDALSLLLLLGPWLLARTRLMSTHLR